MYNVSMITKCSFGEPVDTGAVLVDVSKKVEQVPVGTLVSAFPFEWKFVMDGGDIVYGLGESVRGMNKRGFKYISWCCDQPSQNESAHSMYGAHNFFIVFGKRTFGIFFDTASRISFDIGWTHSDTITVTCDETGVNLYTITADEDGFLPLESISRQFRKMIGQSYIPPRWAFGFQQSRWGYRTEKDVLEVVRRYEENNIPLDAVCLDIDYMSEYEDFTVDEKKFPDMKKLVSGLAKKGVRLVPIIDAGVKKKEGYSVYDEGHEKGFFCKKEDGSEYVAGVWPGRSHFVDFLNDRAASWFGMNYRTLTDLGIEGFWNDMNEPAMFYSDESLKEVFDHIKSLEGKNLDIDSFFEFTPLSGSTFNRKDDYERFYHEMTQKDGSTKRFRHDKVHNLFGGRMTKAASDALEKILPEKRVLLYSRASTIGAHRYGGIWTGDCCSWWSHLEMQIKMLPALNLCGFLYTGSDTGGFGDSSTRDLVLRWTAFSTFTPLMRNHSAWNTREQECYSFEHPEDFKSILDLRYALIPYIYSEYMKAALNGTMLFRPLSFVWPDDSLARETEDQLLVGDGIMIAPVYKQNATGRYVYLPENMTQVTWRKGKAAQAQLQKGIHFVEVPLDSVVFFVRQGKLVPLAKPARSVDFLDPAPADFVGDGDRYEMYDDDGFTRDTKIDGHLREIVRKR